MEACGTLLTIRIHFAFLFLLLFFMFLQACPEHLAVTKYQTVARLRNKIFRRLSPGLLAIFKHQHTVDDLEVFFIVTALLSGDGNETRRPEAGSPDDYMKG
jgi:hypothetical protein